MPGNKSLKTHPGERKEVRMGRCLGKGVQARGMGSEELEVGQHH